MTQNAINNSASSMDIDNLNIDGNTISSTDTNGNIILAPDGSGDVSITSASIVPSTDRVDSLGSPTNSWDNLYADGVTFDDGSNILSSYLERTTFTPTLEFGGASVGITYSLQQGSYARIGNFVFLQIQLIITNKGSSTGAATIPGPVLNTAASTAVVFPCRWNAINLDGTRTVVNPVIGGNDNLIQLQQCGDNTSFTNLTDTNFSNTSAIFMSGVYLTS